MRSGPCRRCLGRDGNGSITAIVSSVVAWFARGRGDRVTSVCDYRDEREAAVAGTLAAAP